MQQQQQQKKASAETAPTTEPFFAGERWTTAKLNIMKWLLATFCKA